MDENISDDMRQYGPLGIGPLTYSTSLEINTPWYLEVGNKMFYWDDEQQCYPGLYVESESENGEIDENTYYELEVRS